MPLKPDGTGRPPRGSPAWQLSCLGDRLARAGRYEAAIVAYRHALTQDPGRAEIHNSLGVALHRTGAVEEAVAAYYRALEIDPVNVRAQSNLGAAHMDRNETALAIAAYERALSRSRYHPKIRTNLAFAQMLQGDLLAGWRNYESRWAAGARVKGRTFPTPAWLGGRSLAGRSILLGSEQGLGDMMQFARFVPEVVRLGARVHLEAEPGLRRLFASSFPEVIVSTVGEAVAAVDEHCTVPSLPLAFGTGLDSIPARVPYLRSLGRTPARWPELGPPSGRPRIGLAWSGFPGHHNDRNRSIPFARFAALLSGLDFRWVSLQKEVRENDAAALAGLPAVANLSARIGDFADTAALAEEVDLVIAVDTSIAHLAGAMGKPVWVLLPFAPDWRWLLGRSDSPWYPTMRLFRQPKPGDWESVFAAVREQLAARFAVA